MEEEIDEICVPGTKEIEGYAQWLGMVRRSLRLQLGRVGRVTRGPRRDRSWIPLPPPRPASQSLTTLVTTTKLKRLG